MTNSLPPDIYDSVYHVCETLAGNGHSALALSVLQKLYGSDEILHVEACEIADDLNLGSVPPITTLENNV
jgi:hypothetical protein